MAFDGVLMRIGSYEVDGENYINEKSYKVTKNSQDLDSYRDADGVLHRTVLSHTPIKIEFQTRPLNNVEWNEFWSEIKSQFLEQGSAERKVMVEAYIPEEDDYITQQMYIPDPEFSINHISSPENIIYYNSIRLAFIGY